MSRYRPSRTGWLLLVFVLCVTAFPALGQDPVKTDPAFNRVEFENDRVRVLRIRLGPGEKDSFHQHPASIAVSLTDQHVRVTGADNASRELQRKAGDVRFLEPAVHKIENLSSSPYETILIELKGSPRDPGK